MRFKDEDVKTVGIASERAAKQQHQQNKPKPPPVIAVKAYPPFWVEGEDGDIVGPIHVEMARVICNDIRSLFGRTKEQQKKREAERKFREMAREIRKDRR